MEMHNHLYNFCTTKVTKTKDANKTSKRIDNTEKQRNNNKRNKCSNITPKYLGTNNCSTHPHNNFFQVLGETGFLGCIFYLLIFFEMIKLFIKNYLNRKSIKKFSLIFYLIPTIFYLNPFLPSGKELGTLCLF